MNWNIDPIALSFFGIKIYWYGILFFFAIIISSLIMKYIYRLERMPEEHIFDQLLNVLIGVFSGARIVECLFYNPEYYWNNPLKVFSIWEGGLASHGGAIGIIVVIFLYTKKYKINFIWIFDRLVIAIAIFAFFIRLANFANSEILGIPTDLPWAITFLKFDLLPRHPVQLYEAFTFLMIFVLLVYIYSKSRTVHRGSLLGIFLSLTFTARFLLEFLKERQAYYANDFFLSVGQLLSIPFIFIGLFLLFRLLKDKKSDYNDGIADSRL